MARISRCSTVASSWATASSRPFALAAAASPSCASISRAFGRRPTGLGIELPSGLDETLERGIRDLLGREDLDAPESDASVRITVSRGPYRGRGLLPPDEHVPATVAVQVWPVTPPPAGHLEDGIGLVASSVRRDPANPLAALKTTSRADYVFARLEARRAGADDALFLTLDGHLSEATSANVFLVRDRELATPALACAILAGTTRSWLLRLGLVRRPCRVRGLADTRRSRGRRRGVRVLVGRRRAARDPLGGRADRDGPARSVDAPCARRS